MASLTAAFLAQDGDPMTSSIDCMHLCMAPEAATESARGRQLCHRPTPFTAVGPDLQSAAAASSGSPRADRAPLHGTKPDQSVSPAPGEGPKPIGGSVESRRPCYRLANGSAAWLGTS